MPIVPVTHLEDVFLRATDEEDAVIEALVQGADVRTRRLWEARLGIRHDASEYAALLEVVTESFTAARAAELLAPSEG